VVNHRFNLRARDAVQEDQDTFEQKISLRDIGIITENSGGISKSMNNGVGWC